MRDSRPADRVPARTEAQAKERFRHFLSQSLTVLSPSAVWLVQPGRDGLHAIFTVPEILELRCADDVSVFLRSTIQFRYGQDPRPGREDEQKVFTLDYAHTLGETETLKPQLYSWEWSATGSHYPHVHVRRNNANFPGLGKLHVPTGRVFFEHVALFLIYEYGLAPAREDWQEVLGDNLERVATWATWGGGTAPQSS